MCWALTRIPVIMDWKTYVVNPAVLPNFPNLMYRFSEVPIKPDLAFL